MWERPDDLIGRQDVDKMVSNLPDTVGTPGKTTKPEESSESSDDDSPPVKKVKMDEPKRKNFICIFLVMREKRLNNFYNLNYLY